MKSKRTVFLTGGSRGIGRAIKEVLSEDDVYRIEAPSRAELDLSAGFALAEEYFARLQSEGIKPDIVINCAGINELRALPEIEEKVLALMFNVNVFAPLKISQQFVPHMKEQNWGRIVNICSITAVISRERRIIYTMTKTALHGLTKGLAVELAPHNILVNSLSPGYVKTDLTDQNLSPEEQARLAAMVPLGRFAEPREIAQAVKFLVSEENTYTTGQNLITDGGRVSR